MLETKSYFWLRNREYLGPFFVTLFDHYLKDFSVALVNTRRIADSFGLASRDSNLRYRENLLGAVKIRVSLRHESGSSIERFLKDGFDYFRLALKSTGDASDEIT